MAVYFERQYKPWWADLATATLSGLVKGMFDRDAAARAQRVNANRWGEFEKLYDEASGQYAAPQESPLTIQGAPETKKLSQLFAPQQNAFGSDPFGGVPEQFRPQEGDGLVGTAVKALQNNAIRGRTPTIDDVYKWGAQSGAINDPNFQKFVEARFGSRFKMQDADRLASRLGNMPQYNDRQGTLNYVGNRALYDPDGAKTVGNFIQHLNPGFNNQAVNLGNRQVVLSQDKYTGETTPVFGGAVGVSPDTAYAQNAANRRQEMALEAAEKRSANAYAPVRDEQRAIRDAWGKAGEMAGMFGGSPAEFEQAVRGIDPTLSPAAVEQLLGDLRKIPQLVDSRGLLSNNPLYGYNPAPAQAGQGNSIPPAVLEKYPETTQQEYDELVRQGLKMGKTLEEIERDLLGK
ncbi:hypothetical protein [Pyramidobacter sp. C12-8]|uniref:hypothetical protein n=1 Tax=Pyramidobacter sp. C12-8 TaxID=1943580 RepID=UPI00098FDBA6|nr:hypothetical protein [Pyramidobacter sp. C12-8]OON89700.1 hypothetical protein B0D78_02415 [Pyramidobacter sp. C12-8]